MKEDKNAEEFVVSVGLTSAQAANQLAKFGRNELPEKIIPKVSVCLQPCPLLLCRWLDALSSNVNVNHL